jgi:hypothetical protein
MQESIKLKSNEEGYLIIGITFYDEMVHRIDRVSYYQPTYEERISSFADIHKIFGHSIRFGEFLGEERYSLREEGESRLLFTK